jgi:hypothetical protein
VAGEEPTVTLAPEATINALPEGAAARRAALAQSTPPGSSASLQFARDTLRDEEVATARGMIKMGRLIGVACLLVLPLLGGAPELRVAMAVAIVVALVVGYVVELRLRQPERYGERLMIALALSVCPGAFLAYLYFGIFSAVQLFPALAMYFFARRERFASALALYLVNGVAQGVFAALVISGVIDDPGLFKANQPTLVLIAGHLLIQVGDLGAFLLGQASHRASREAIEKMRHAMLLAAQREALLVEARQDLDRALQLGASGRYTDHHFGSYRLGTVIGRGGMGEVYEAWHVGTGEAAAVKLLPHGELGNPRSVERFVREVRAVGKLSSPHVVRVLETSAEGDAIPFLAMERLHGQDLAHLLRAGGLPRDGLDKLLAQVGAALEEAWQHGIVHRDLKPHNLFLVDSGGGWRVLDFGVAALADHSGTLTSGHVVGTPAYMSPEQARGEKVDHRADLYALTAIAYRWLTGRPVVTGKDMHTALYQTVHVMPQRPSAFGELHDDVDAVLAIGLVKDPARRWDSVGELRAALAAALDGRLDPALRERGAAITADHPWGAVRT